MLSHAIFISYTTRESEVREVTPGDFGLEEADPAGLAGGDAAHNAGIARAVLGGATGAVRTAVLMEAAAALHACGIAGDFREGKDRAAAVIDSGEATRTLELWARLSVLPPPRPSPLRGEGEA